MLMQIGNPDSYLRDELIYRSFGKVISSDQLNSEEIQHLLGRSSGGLSILWDWRVGNGFGIYTFLFSTGHCCSY